jgi:hypothetical protein
MEVLKMEILNLKYVIGVLKDDEGTLKIKDLKVIRCTNNPSMELAIDRYKAISGHDGIMYPIQVVCKIENNVIDTYDDAIYYVENDPDVRQFIVTMV